jgi:hypothetical protein
MSLKPPHTVLLALITFLIILKLPNSPLTLKLKKIHYVEKTNTLETAI